MKILVVTSYNNGQIAPFILEQVESLRAQKIECDYFLLKGKGWRGYLHNLPQLRQRIDDTEPDLIHAHYGLCGLLSNLQRKVPVVTTYHGSDTHGWRNRMLSRWCCRLSASNIFVGESIRLSVANKKTHVIPCGVDMRLFAPIARDEARRRLSLPTDQSLVLFAGSYDDPVKNIALARKAMQQIPRTRLIELRGYSRQEVAWLFSAVDLLLLTSHSEGSPQVVKEALACGCPIVSVDVGDVKLQTEGVEGCTIVPRQADVIAKAVKKTCECTRNTDSRKLIYERHLDNESVSKRLLEVYRAASKKEKEPTEIKTFSLDETILQDIASQWVSLYEHSSSATVFQSQEFFNFCKILTFWEPFAYGVTEDGLLKGVIAGFIQKEGDKIRQFFTCRAIVNGGPLLADDISDEALKALLDTCSKNLWRKAIYIETRNLKDYKAYRHAFYRCQFKYEPHYNFQLHLSKDLDCKNLYHKSIIRDLKSAYGKGVKVCHNPNIEDVKIFYHILQHLYMTRVKTPLFPWEFFERAFYNPLFHYIIVKSPDDVVIGGMLTLLSSNKAVYEWFVAHDYTADKSFYPSAVVYDAAINNCHEKSTEIFDFMGAGKPGDNGYGVREYKAKFGGTLVEHGRFVRKLHIIRYYLGCLAVKILKMKK